MLTAIDLVKNARKSISEVDNAKVCEAIDNKKLIIDVREPDEYAQGFIGNSISVPRGLIEFAVYDHPSIKDFHNTEDIGATEIYVYCKSGGRSALAAQSLQSLGFKNVHSLQQGIIGWQKEGLKIDDTQQYHY